MIRENTANRGTEASAEFLVGPPWRMESNAGQQQRREVRSQVILYLLDAQEVEANSRC
jgi:hypothetical protein